MNIQIITWCQNDEIIEIKLSPIFGRTEEERAMGDYTNSYRGNSNAAFCRQHFPGSVMYRFLLKVFHIDTINWLQCKSKYTIHYLTRVTAVTKAHELSHLMTEVPFERAACYVPVPIRSIEHGQNLNVFWVFFCSLKCSSCFFQALHHLTQTFHNKR